MLKLKKTEEVLFFLTILFLPTQLGQHFWPDFAHIYSLKIDYLSPTIYFWDLLIVLLLIVFLLQKKYVNQKALNLNLAFIFTQLLSIVVTAYNQNEPWTGLVRLEQFFVTGLFGVYIASQKYEEIKKRIVLPLSIAVISESLLVFYQVYSNQTLGLWILGERSFSIQTPGIAKFDFYGREILRPYATFPHPNVLAGFLVISLILVQKFAKDNLLKIISLSLATVTTLLTFSRVAVLVLFSILISFGKKWVLLVLGIVILTSPFLYPRFSSLFNFDSLTILRREELAEVSLELFSDSPLFGVGLNRFIIEGSNQILIGPSRFLQPVHNIFLLNLAETGLVGFIGLIILVAYPIFQTFRLKPFFLLWGVIVFLGLFDHYFLTLPQGLRILFLVWGLSFSAKIYR